MKEIQLSLLRQKAIKELIAEKSISDQKQIIELLKEKYGIETNQAVVSRDLRKLGVVKKTIHEVLVYEVAEMNVQAEIFRLALVDIDHNESMIVIKTVPGLADFVGDQLDQCKDLDILGCLAGENVVFIVPKTVATIRATFKAICKRFQFKEPNK